MKIAFLSGGPSCYYHAFCELLGEKLDLTVVYERHMLGNRDQSWADVSGNSYKTIWLKGINVGNEMAFCPEIIRYLRNERFDLVVLHNYLSPTGMLASLYMQMYHIPFAIHADGAMKKETERTCIRFLKRFFVSKACAYLSSGKQTDEYFVFYGADARRIFRYPFTSVYKRDILCKPLSKSEKRRLRNLLGMKERTCDTMLVLYVGSIIPRKGVDLLLQCAKRIEDRAEIFVVGGEPSEKMEQWMKRHRITNVTFRGFEPSEKIKQYMRCADLFVLPTRYDIWGLVVNEAMAAGLPVITTNCCVSGIELIENGKNGRIVCADSAKELSAGIGELLTLSETERRQMGALSLEKIRTYSLEEMARVYKDRLTEITGKTDDFF